MEYRERIWQKPCAVVTTRLRHPRRCHRLSRLHSGVCSGCTGPLAAGEPTYIYTCIYKCIDGEAEAGVKRCRKGGEKRKDRGRTEGACARK